MACRLNELRRPSRNAMLRRYRRAARCGGTASAPSRFGRTPLTPGSARDHGLGLDSGSQHASAGINGFTHVESCAKRDPRVTLE